jgi:acetylornithine deacetylase/succinyl-diaminopimelate desuccinylase-like protein
LAIKLLKENEKELTTLLSNLIQINTTNPPGNETAAAKFIAQTLQEDDIPSEIIESAPTRGSLITKLKGTGKKPNLLLLGHIDVVAANPAEWSIPPFEGTVKDGYVWGRGAYDMKGMVAVELMTLKLLKRNNIPLQGDVMLAATADEECGGEAGAGYLLRNFREKIWAPYVINEGGGLAVPTKKGNVFTVQTAEKGILWFKIKAKGTPGHGSMPNMADNAVLRMNKVISILSNYRAKIEFVPTLKQYLDVVAEFNEHLSEPFAKMQANPEQSETLLDELEAQGEMLAQEIKPRIKMTLSPTMIKGGIKENIIPSECEATFDCRVLPGQSVDATLALFKGLLVDVGLDKLSFEIIQMHGGSESNLQTPLYEAITSTLKDLEPNCGVTPMLTTGGTDSRFFREAGSVCYGFHPMIPDEPQDKLEKRMHGIDERITIDNLVFGTTVLYEAVKRFMT